MYSTAQAQQKCLFLWAVDLAVDSEFWFCSWIVHACHFTWGMSIGLNWRELAGLRGDFITELSSILWKQGYVLRSLVYAFAFCIVACYGIIIILASKLWPFSLDSWKPSQQAQDPNDMKQDPYLMKSTYMLSIYHQFVVNVWSSVCLIIRREWSLLGHIGIATSARVFSSKIYG